MIDRRGQAAFGLTALILTFLALASATAQQRPVADRQWGFDPAISLLALRLATPNPITASAEAGLDAARAELAAGFALSDLLAAGVPLTPPARGPRVEVFGQQQAGGLRAQGITFRVESGAMVRAPTGGDVLYARPLEGLGGAVIIQATPRAQVVLAGDFSVRVREGESLREGQVLGRMADRGAATNLYLELRDLGRPLNPEPWLRPQNAAVLGSGFNGETG